MAVLVPIKNPDLTDKEHTYLTSACAASDSSVTVADYSGFSDDDYLVLGIYGKERAEIVLVDDAAIDATISLDATDEPVYAHPVNTKVTVMPYNQAQLYSAATEAACDALTGSDTPLATIDLQVDNEYTTYDDTSGTSTTWYKVRFKNVVGTTYSSFSDSVQVGGFKANSRGRLKLIVRSLFGDKHGKWVSEDDLDNFFYQVESEVFDYRRKWSFLQTEGTFTLTAGVHKYDLAAQLTDIKAPTKNYIENIWIHDNAPFTYKDRKEFDSLLEGAKWTTVASDISSGDTSLTLTDGSKLDDSGTCYMEGDDIAYTDITSNTMTATAGEVDADHDAGVEVWQDTELDEPAFFTIWGGDLFVSACPDDSYICSVNYYRKGEPCSEDNDISEIPASSNLLIQGVLAYCYQNKQDNTLYKEKRGEFINALKDMAHQERLGQAQYLQPPEDEALEVRDWDKGHLYEIKNQYRTS